ncbi:MULTISPECIES: retropepsin-like aspartic protease family protein [Hoeflea]|jgi:aspartyl protease family protein|uniref:TIGR02281 family clan AA aspartic protease n=1 Tax=Hoeflea alexandrii TaxID=288436 RepID=A0ABT1CRV7_9HYPH|nr:MULTISPECIES: TIGR02281 family clan AA aspartic protease [Hoeflea]MCO6408948.1 TIGR02281 family clan AA aspartic protease [Hoeflea alexandrii]VVT30390.1 conserved exported hypothetical protein [Hoeflea sp. EC-HK425]
MIKNIFLVSCAVLAISGLPYYAQDISSFLASETAPEAASARPVAYQPQTAKAQPKAHYATGVRAAVIPMTGDGHFSSDFRINGRLIKGLIDTGATYVAINVSTARTLGLGLANSDFRHQVRTANGVTRAALVNLDKMEIGAISVDDVEAFVLDDKALSSTLIGMSFMSKLQSYRVKDNRLELVN